MFSLVSTHPVVEEEGSLSRHFELMKKAPYVSTEIMPCQSLNLPEVKFVELSFISYNAMLAGAMTMVRGPRRLRNIIDPKQAFKDAKERGETSSLLSNEEI